MRKILKMLILFFSLGIFSQENDGMYSYQFNNKNLINILEEIEEEAGVTFYFDEKWILDKTYSGNFIGEPLDTILETVLQDTDLNFFKLNDVKIILTQNNCLLYTSPSPRD